MPTPKKCLYIISISCLSATDYQYYIYVFVYLAILDSGVFDMINVNHSETLTLNGHGFIVPRVPHTAVTVVSGVAFPLVIVNK